MGKMAFWKSIEEKDASDAPSTQHLLAEKKLEKAEARIKYLEAENELLNKLEELERKAMKRKYPHMNNTR